MPLLTKKYKIIYTSQWYCAQKKIINSTSTFARKKPQMKLNRLAHENQINFATHRNEKDKKKLENKSTIINRIK